MHIWHQEVYDYLLGRHFDLVTDHKPLLGLLKEDLATHLQASARIKRWSLFLSNFEYTLAFRNTAAHANADALSRLPLPEELAKTFTDPELFLLAEHLSDSPVTVKDIQTGPDRIRRYREFCRDGRVREMQVWSHTHRNEWSSPVLKDVCCGDLESSSLLPTDKLS